MRSGLVAVLCLALVACVAAFAQSNRASAQATPGRVPVSLVVTSGDTLPTIWRLWSDGTVELRHVDIHGKGGGWMVVDEQRTRP